MRFRLFFFQFFLRQPLWQLFFNLKRNQFFCVKRYTIPTPNDAWRLILRREDEIVLPFFFLMKSGVGYHYLFEMFSRQKFFNIVRFFRVKKSTRFVRTTLWPIGTKKMVVCFPSGIIFSTKSSRNFACAALTRLRSFSDDDRNGLFLRSEVITILIPF